MNKNETELCFIKLFYECFTCTKLNRKRYTFNKNGKNDLRRPTSTNRCFLQLKIK